MILPQTSTRIKLPIPNCPKTGLLREIDDYDMYWARRVRQLIITCEVRFYKQIDENTKEEIVKARQDKKLVASNTLVYAGANQQELGRFLTNEEVNIVMNHDALVTKYNADMIVYQQQYAMYENMHQLWVDNDGAASNIPEPIEPIEPTPIPDPLTCMEEFDFYSFVIGGGNVNVPALIAQTLQQRAFNDMKFEDIVA